MVVRCPVLFFFKVVEYPDGLVCMPLWSPYFKHYTVAMIAVVFYVPLVLITILYLTIAITIFNNQISENCGRTISQQERTTFKESENRWEDLYCYRVSIYNGLAATQYLVVGVLLFIRQNSDMVLWIQYLTEIVRFLMYSYCAVNPCFCFISIGHYRQGLRILFSCFSMAPGANQVAPP